MKYAQQAKEYRLDGKYHLALRCAQASKTTMGRIEEVRAMCWLARYSEAEEALSQLTPETRSEQAEFLYAAVICRINLGQHEHIQHLAKQICLMIENSGSITEQIIFHQLLAMTNGVLANMNDAVAHAEAALNLARPFKKTRTYCDACFVYADALHRAQRYPEAMKAWEECITEQKLLMRSDHTELALSFDNFALTLRHLGNPGVSIQFHEHAHSIYTEQLPVHHPAIGACHHGLAQALLRCGLKHRAARNMLLALKCAEHNLPKDHPDIALTRFELGRAEFSCGNETKGLKNMRNAIETSTKQLGPDHPMVQRMHEWVEKLED